MTQVIVEFCDISDCKNNDTFDPVDIYGIKHGEDFEALNKNKAGYKFDRDGGIKDICEIHLGEINDHYPKDKPFLIEDESSRWFDLIVNPIYKGDKNANDTTL